MKKPNLTLVVLILALGFFAIGAGLFYNDFHMRERTEQEYKSLAKLAAEKPSQESVENNPGSEESHTYVSPIDFNKLRQVNPDIVGWIKIEGTNIDYPIVQTTNNETYLNTDIEGHKSAEGAIFLDYESEPDFSGRHNIIYGHHMKNGTMFKDLIRYKDQDFFEKHQNIIIYTPEKEFHLRPVTALYTDASALRRKTGFETEESFQAYVKEMTKGGAFYQNPEEPIERLWSFVTCSYEFEDARTILYASEVPFIDK